MSLFFIFLMPAKKQEAKTTKEEGIMQETLNMKISVVDPLKLRQYDYEVISNVVPGDSIGLILRTFDIGLKEETLEQKTMRIDRTQFIRETERFLAILKGSD